jgi:hypothetical protein
MKITAGIVVRNESAFLRKCVLSIAPFVDSVIIVENGSIDGSDLICDELANNLANVTTIHLGPQASLAVARNVIDDFAEEGWVIWWDADFIAYADADGENRSFRRMITILREGNGRFNQVLYGGPNVGPTFEAVKFDKMHHGADGDAQITWKGLMRFRVDQYIDSRYYTQSCRTRFLHGKEHQFYLHLDKVKPLERLSLRFNLYDYESQKFKKERFEQVEMLEFMYLINPTFDINNLVRDVTRSLAETSIPFDFGKYGPHPKILQEFVENPFFGLDLSLEPAKRKLSILRQFTRNDAIYHRPYFVTSATLNSFFSPERNMGLAPRRRLSFTMGAIPDQLSELNFDQDEFGRFVWVMNSFKLRIDDLDSRNYVRIGISAPQGNVAVFATPLDDKMVAPTMLKIHRAGLNWLVFPVGAARTVEVRLIRQDLANRSESIERKFKLYYTAKTDGLDGDISTIRTGDYVRLPATTSLLETLKN